MTAQNPKLALRMSAAARKLVEAELTNGQDSTNPAFTFSCTDSALLLAMADGVIDPVELAKAELANRGLDADGVWCGFDRAREIQLGVADDNAPDPTAETTVAEIARRILHLDTIDTRNADALDFHQLAVWTIRDALMAAYHAGAQATGNGHATGEG
jgi:hypothetical protein